VPARDQRRFTTDAHARALGRYYTPAALIEAVLDAALEPLLDSACEAPGPRGSALRQLRIVDPACGDGRFLVAAARRVARRLEQLGDPAPLAAAAACVRGVDVDPAAVEATRTALMAIGVPATLAGRHVRAGDALLGAALLGDARPTAPGGGLDWGAAFPDVRAAGGFDAVLGNPPWIAHAGRAAQPLPTAVRERYRARFASFRGYPTTHGCFVERAAAMLRPGGRLGLVVPASMLELGGYAAARRAHDALCVPDPRLSCFGEGRFDGVTQPCAALVSTRREAPWAEADGRRWGSSGDHLDAAGAALLARAVAWQPLPAALFAERGLRCALGDLLTAPRTGGVPVREGRDVSAFTLATPRLWAPLELAERSVSALRGVSFLVRQTARFPIAARTDGAWFRNSLLAGLEHPDWPARLVVPLLNASFVRWLHHARHMDARQPVLPQVKLSHLRTIPAPPLLTPRLRDALMAREWTDAAAVPLLDRLVHEAYGLDAAERACVEAWRRDTVEGPRGPRG
jgi:SAM-dependent methyltransferase